MAVARWPMIGAGAGLRSWASCYTLREGPSKQVVERGLAYLGGTVVANQGRANQTRNNHGGYVQAVTAIALCDAYAVSQDGRLAAPSQLALNFIQSCQDPVGGGWMQRPRQSSCTSVTAFTVMALKSGHMGYLQVSPLTVKRASEFPNSVASDYGSTYGYQDAVPRESLGPAGVALPDVSRLAEGTSGHRIGRQAVCGQGARPAKHVLQVLRHAGHASLRRGSVDGLERQDARLSRVEAIQDRARYRRSVLQH